MVSSRLVVSRSPSSSFSGTAIDSYGNVSIGGTGGSSSKRPANSRSTGFQISCSRGNNDSSDNGGSRRQSAGGGFSQRTRQPAGNSPARSPASRSPSIVQIWSDANVISLLKSISRFQRGKAEGVRSLYSYVQWKLSYRFDKEQIRDKVKRLKRKYKNQAKSGCSVFLKQPHDEAIFELSKKLWGGEVAGQNDMDKFASQLEQDLTEAGGAIPLGVSVAPQQQGIGGSGFGTAMSLGCSNDVIAKGLELIGTAKRQELEMEGQMLLLAQTEATSRFQEFLCRRDNLAIAKFREAML